MYLLRLLLALDGQDFLFQILAGTEYGDLLDWNLNDLGRILE